MADVLYSCSFVPPEWIEAHGHRLVRVIPSPGTATDALPEAGVCPFARSYAAHVLHAGAETAAVFTTRCDQLRRLFDIVAARRMAPVFLLNVPATWQSAAAERLYAAELQRMGRWLRQLDGAVSPSNTPLAFQVDPPPVLPSPKSRCSDASVRLAVTGGPLSAASTFPDQIRAAGGMIVLDLTESSEALRAGRCECRSLTADAALEVARVNLAVPSIHQRPNHAFLDMLRTAAVAHDVEGLIVRRFVWCDLWRAESRRIAEQVGLPVLELEVETELEAADARTSTRIEGFLEMLRANRCPAHADSRGQP